MIKIFFPGQTVPVWLQEVSPVGCMKFGGLAMVYRRDGSFHIRDLIGFDNILRVDPSDQIITIQGQSPAGCNGGVILHGKPVITWVAAASFAITLLAASRILGYA
jgi:hypothetical protein